jgi:hypothetical protein
MQDPRIDFLNDIAMDGSRVIYSESPIVLLCGGRTPQKERPDDADPPLSSLRHAITLENTSFEIFMPEEITDWHIDGIYQNLMDCEADLSGICSLVVIVLESPGSIAELGAFSQLTDLSHRLMVITSDSFSTDSFIELGILRHIKSQNHIGSVRSYPWVVPAAENIVFNIDSSVVQDVINDVSDQLLTIPQNPVFKRKNNSHVIALIYQIIHTFIALKLNEILEYLRSLGIDIDERQLISKLFLLERFKIIFKDTYSDSTYYAINSESFHRIRFGHREKIKAVDLVRIKASCSVFYGASNDRHRVGFLKKISKRARW